MSSSDLSERSDNNNDDDGGTGAEEKKCYGDGAGEDMTVIPAPEEAP